MRTAASSIEEICTRHGAISLIHYEKPTPEIPAYSALAIYADGAATIRQTLTAALISLRAGYEIDDVYVRPMEEKLFEPLQARHFASVGEWIIAARRCHPHHDPRIIGIMLAKDEADIIPDVIASLFPMLSALYFYAYDEATKNAVLSCSTDGKAYLMPPPPEGVQDGYRQAMLERSRDDKDARDHRPTWIMNIQGDEIYEDDLLHHIRLAQRERATVLNAQVATFLLHESQKDGWDWSLPIKKRLNHYIWDFGEHAGFLDFPWIYYQYNEHMRAHPHGMYPAKWASAKPIRRHYPFRNPEQARARIEDRLTTGWQPHYINYKNVFMGFEAAGLPVRKYHGWFGEAVRDTEGIW